MEPTHTLPLLLAVAWLLPLASFAAIVFWGPRMGRHGHCAAYLASTAIVVSCVLSLAALGIWLRHAPLAAPLTAHSSQLTAHSSQLTAHSSQLIAEGNESHSTPPIAGDWLVLGRFGRLQLTLGYYIDVLTLAMFCMVTFVASCIHFYSFGYMHEELHEVTDPLAPLADGRPLVRPGRYPRFFQYLSLFCFSMLGLVLAGNVLMVFIFWELVGICSYFLIGFYRERHSASCAANKAFIVNRVGDFGMIVGLMALWGGLGTFSFQQLFDQVRPAAAGHALTVPGGMSYGLLVIAGLGIFCGCVGKSAQFPLHVWLPDAMEGPTPVSALIHAATMVAAGVYLVGRLYPLFTPEVLLVIAYVGCITLVIAASIAITATDIKRVLAYSTVSQLGYMMLALGAGGWVAGLFHLFNHAFFKALLFLGSGSVIHATGTNEMPRMGGLLRKMPWTAGTMLVGCLAISGAGIPTIIGLSGYYSKDSILAQLFSFKSLHPAHAWLFYAAVGGAAVTAFYMFRLWCLTFIGPPRDQHVYDHAHESPRIMYVPLVILAVLAVASGWDVPLPAPLDFSGSGSFGLTALLEQARPLGTAEGAAAGQLWPTIRQPAEHLSHAPAIHVPISLVAFAVAFSGFAVAWAFYGLRWADPEGVRRRFALIYDCLVHKWWFDELYWAVLVRPTLFLSRCTAGLDRKGIDFVADGLARSVCLVSTLDDLLDRWLVDGLVNATARGIYAAGLRLRALQAGSLRLYVMYIAGGTVALFVLISFYWNIR